MSADIPRHTSGPWRWVEDHGYPETRLMASEELQVLSIYESHGGGNAPEEADAHLIAAAPDLLDALRDAEGLAIAWSAVYQFNHGLSDIHPTHQEIVTKIRSAIQKAEGAP